MYVTNVVKPLLPYPLVCGSIHKNAGPGLLLECVRLRPCVTGKAVITRGVLCSKYLIDF